MAKVVLVLDVKDENIDKHGLKYAVDSAFSPSEVVVEEALDYPFKGPFRTDYLAILDDVEVTLSNNFNDELNVTDEQIAEITAGATDRLNENACAEIITETILDEIDKFIH